ncbi:MAG: 2-hydroxyacyl-CoA dehydratase subunit D [Thermoplasmata archaeon]
MSGKPKRKEIRASKQLRDLLRDYYQDLDSAASNGGKVAWCSSVGPAELLVAFGYKVYFPENHSALIGVRRAADDYIPVANAAGYSPEICSYLTSDIGAFLRNETPLKDAYGVSSIPKPDVLALNTNQCRDLMEWFSFYSRHFDAPLLTINPPKYLDEVEEMHVDDVASQFDKMVSSLEKITGEKLDEEKLKEAVSLSLEATEFWKAVLDTATHLPSPLTFFDGTVHMAPIVILRGNQCAVDYYKVLKDELDERIENGIAAVDDERFRLYWEGMPVWGRLRKLSEQFLELKACLVASTYCNSWIFDDMTPADPIRSMALAYTKVFVNRSEPAKERYLLDMIKKFKVDGIVFHDARTCPNNSNARYGMPTRLMENHGIPVLTLDGDLNDLRCWSDDQATTNIEAFVEQLEER